MKPLLALLAATAVLVLAAPAGARPIDLNTPSPSSAPAPAPAPAAADTSGGGSETWVVLLAAGVAFVAGAAGARLALVRRTSPAV